MDISAYLHRIRYTGPLQPTASTLRDLHLAHLLAVPFENLDIHLGRPIALDLEALYHKVVDQHRGGFCYELNGLFAHALIELGYRVILLSASDSHADGTWGPEYDHLTLMVQCPDEDSLPWLVDVGWGDSFRVPLRLNDTGVQEERESGRAYRLDMVGDDQILWQRDEKGAWEQQYGFTRRPRAFQDYAGMCLYHQRSVKSPFTRKRLCTIATPDGRITLSDTRLITTSNGVRDEKVIGDDAEYRNLLRAHFGVDLDDTARWIKPEVI